MRAYWKPSVHDARLKRLWPNREISVQAISDILGFGERTIQKRARELGLDPRPSGRAPENKRNREIVEKFKQGASREALAVEYGISVKSIYRITPSVYGKKEQR